MILKSVKMSLKEVYALIGEVVKASAAYMKKERVRTAFERVIVEEVKSGNIKDQKDLEEFFATAKMSLDALKMVPYDVYTKVAKPKK